MRRRINYYMLRIIFIFFSLFHIRYSYQKKISRNNAIKICSCFSTFMVPLQWIFSFPYITYSFMLLVILSILKQKNSYIQDDIDLAVKSYQYFILSALQERFLVFILKIQIDK